MGEDPVYPTPAAYKVLADKLATMVDDMLAETTSTPASTPPTKKEGRSQGALDPQLRASRQASDPCSRL